MNNNNNDNQNDNSKKKKGIKLADSMFEEIDKSLYNFNFDEDDEESKDFYEFEDKNWDSDFTPIGTVDDEFFKPRKREYITKNSSSDDSFYNSDEWSPTKKSSSSSLESQFDLKIDNALKDEIVSIFDTHEEKPQQETNKQAYKTTKKSKPTTTNKVTENQPSSYVKEEEFTLFEEDKNNLNDDENVTVDEQHIRSLMESAFYVYGHEGLSLHDLKKLTLAPTSTIKKVLKNWIDELDSDSKRGITIKNFGEKYKFFTKNDNREELSRLITIKYRNPLSQKVMETLAIIAYNQPCTKAIIENIRGKDPTMTIQKLIDLGLVNEAGRGDGPGRPLLFTVSHKFYDIFGIKNVSDLPAINLEQPFQDDDVSFFDTTRFND